MRASPTLRLHSDFYCHAYHSSEIEAYCVTSLWNHYRLRPPTMTSQMQHWNPTGQQNQVDFPTERAGCISVVAWSGSAVVVVGTDFAAETGLLSAQTGGCRESPAAVAADAKRCTVAGGAA